MQPLWGLVRGLSVRASDAEIYALLKDDLVQYATALVGPDSAGDVVSTVVVRVLSAGSLGDLREPRPYLFRGVLNEATSTRARAAREPASAVTETVASKPAGSTSCRVTVVRPDGAGLPNMLGQAGGGAPDVDAASSGPTVENGPSALQVPPLSFL